MFLNVSLSCCEYYFIKLKHSAIVFSLLAVSVNTGIG